MGAVFTDLHDVAQLLAEHIQTEIGIGDVQPGNPRLVTATTEPAARITLLYTTPQPTHRNDQPERQPSGELRVPPFTLSCSYLITTSGVDADDPIAAHSALGRIMTLFHDGPVLTLPDDAGDLHVVQVPMTLDQIDKIWTSLESQLQPWALFEVAPVQLRSPLPDRGPAPVVLPGGIRLDVRAGRRPLITRITPSAVRPLGRVRIDALIDGNADAILTGGLEVAVSGPPILLSLDHGGLEDLGPGGHAFSVRSRGLISRQSTLRVAEPGAPVIDAPDGPHSASADLAVTGANLAEATRALLWPDAGVDAPSDVHELPVSDVTATGVRITAPASAEPGTYRLVVRLGTRVYTPYVVLELAA